MPRQPSRIDERVEGIPTFDGARVVHVFQRQPAAMEFPAMANQKYRIVCAYSGGLDTSHDSMAEGELRRGDHYPHGQSRAGDDLPAVKAKALRTGAIHAEVDDLQSRFVDEFIWPAVKAGALYEGRYRSTPRWGVRSWPSDWSRLRSSTVRMRSHMGARARAMTRCASR